MIYMKFTRFMMVLQVQSTVSAILSNENHLVPVDSKGNVKSWVGAETSITIYEGGEDVTSKWNIAVTYGAGLTATYDPVTHIMEPSALTTDASYAEFKCTRSNYASIIKRYTITKQYAGSDWRRCCSLSVRF